ncbi:hypothetical protein E2C01_025729 [Portunus trituberculatus]|uniref:Uncharacterized protein n=1 Tax=Portunus trituberculatus TaxID=210409 RepID=A0A5B7EGQ4_PORTR|nr:hypothetical protein [Portunus trituberculatus]
MEGARVRATAKICHRTVMPPGSDQTAVTGAHLSQSLAAGTIRAHIYTAEDSVWRLSDTGGRSREASASPRQSWWYSKANWRALG